MGEDEVVEVVLLDHERMTFGTWIYMHILGHSMNAMLLVINFYFVAHESLRYVVHIFEFIFSDLSINWSMNSYCFKFSNLGHVNRFREFIF